MHVVAHRDFVQAYTHAYDDYIGCSHNYRVSTYNIYVIKHGKGAGGILSR